jgi:hypothetical protein
MVGAPFLSAGAAADEGNAAVIRTVAAIAASVEWIFMVTLPSSKDLRRQRKALLTRIHADGRESNRILSVSIRVKASPWLRRVRA